MERVAFIGFLQGCECRPVYRQAADLAAAVNLPLPIEARLASTLAELRETSDMGCNLRRILAATMLSIACSCVPAREAAVPAPASPPELAASAPGTATVENVIGMTMVLLPAGSFLMGSEEPLERLRADFQGYELQRFLDLADEAPVHEVRITRSFYLAKHEVTVGQFARFLSSSGYRPESVADGTGGYGFNPAYDASLTARRDAFEGRDSRYSWRDPGFPQGDDHPVVNVTWNDAQAMARWLSAHEGRTYRLPTEAEWEYACRAGTRTRFHDGDDPLVLLRIANVFDRDSARHWPKWQEAAVDGSDGHAFTAPVGSFSANAWGLHDMHGNVWEWVADWYASDYYRRSPPDDPTGPASGEVRVRRGGSWHSWPFYARSAYRNWNTPKTRYTLVGFRLVLEVDQPATAEPSTTSGAASSTP
jgi:formylglycine-generating enzyme